MSKFEIKESFDNFVYGTFNKLSNAMFQMSKHRRLMKENEKFRNIHQGERCFILGTGPSLKELDPKLLSNEITFGVNYLYKGKIVDELEPQYYCLYDENFYFKHLNDTKEVIEKLPRTTFFFRTNAIDVMQKNNLNGHNIYYQSCKVFQYKDFISVDMTRNMTAPYNVVLGCIQTAMFMGFKEIYLLGCDFNSFASLKLEHFYEQNNKPPREMTLGFELKYYSLVTYHHYALNKYAENNGIKIYNITPNSLLDAYPRKHMNEVFA